MNQMQMFLMGLGGIVILVINYRINRNLYFYLYKKKRFRLMIKKQKEEIQDFLNCNFEKAKIDFVRNRINLIRSENFHYNSYSKFDDKIITKLVEVNKILKELEYKERIAELKEEKEEELALIRVVRPIPAFLDTDGLVYGPLAVGDIVNIPRELTYRILIPKGAAVEIETE